MLFELANSAVRCAASVNHTVPRTLLVVRKLSRMAGRGLPLLLCLSLAAAQPVMIAKPGGYPRLVATNASSTGTPILGAVEAGRGTTHRLVLVKRTSPTAAWQEGAVIVQDATAGVDLSNGFMFQLPNDGPLLCAYRHHTPAPGGGTTYRIQVSRSMDGGASWAPLSTVISVGVGVWEPALYVSPLNASILRVLYSAELTNGGEQDVVQHTSTDGGATWGAVDARVHYPGGGRNGMPGVTVPLPDGSMLLIFERPTQNPGWGRFTVQAVRSLDGGATWSNTSTLVHAPPSTASNAGSPQVAWCPAIQQVVAVYMSDEPIAHGLVDEPVGWEGGNARIRGSGSYRSSPSSSNVVRGGAAAPGWPDEARVWVSYGTLQAGQPAPAPITWTAGAAIPGPATPTIYWPSLLLDEPASPGGPRPLRVVYQGSDGAAWVGGSGGALVATCA